MKTDKEKLDGVMGVIHGLSSIEKTIPIRKISQIIDSERFFTDKTRINGYWAIYDNEDIIWIDCPEEYLPIIINALNEKAKVRLEQYNSDPPLLLPSETSRAGH